MSVHVYGSLEELGGSALGSLYEGSYDLGPIKGAPIFGNSYMQDKVITKIVVRCI